VFEVEAISNLSDSVSRRTAAHGVSGLALIKIQTEKDYQYGDRLMVKGTIMRPGLPNDASRLHSKNMASPDDASRLRPLAAFARRILMFERSREPILIIKHI